MRLAIDLTKYHFKYRRGPMLAVGTWTNFDEEGWVQTLVLYLAADEGKPEMIPCFVRYTDAWVWSEDIGDPRIAARTAADFCAAMRLEVTPHNMIQIASTIHDLLGDLLDIPPFAERNVLGHMLVRNNETGAEADVQLVDV